MKQWLTKKAANLFLELNKKNIIKSYLGLPGCGCGCNGTYLEKNHGKRRSIASDRDWTEICLIQS